MNKEYKEKWVAALRSGKFEQGHNQLRTEYEEFCCLGVLCEVVGLPYEGSDCYPPSEVWKAAGMKSSEPVLLYKGERRFLTSLNDSEELTFSEIADLIEQQL